VANLSGFHSVKNGDFIPGKTFLNLPGLYN
jgi:hypothetical protein